MILPDNIENKYRQNNNKYLFPSNSFVTLLSMPLGLNNYW